MDKLICVVVPVYNVEKYLSKCVQSIMDQVRELFRQVRYPKDKIHEDECTTYQLTYSCKKISYISTPFYYYVMRNTSIMGNLWKNAGM